VETRYCDSGGVRILAPVAPTRREVEMRILLAEGEREPATCPVRALAESELQVAWVLEIFDGVIAPAAWRATRF